MDVSMMVTVLKLINSYGVPLMEAGAEVTDNPVDNCIVAFIRGGLPELIDELEKMPEEEEGSDE